MATLGIRNIGTLISGKVDDPVLDATAILATDGVITKIGGEDIFEGLSVDQMIDANGTTVTPGLLDSHVHPVLGDFTPRQNTLGFMDSGSWRCSTMISAGTILRARSERNKSIGACLSQKLTKCTSGRCETARRSFDLGKRSG